MTTLIEIRKHIKKRKPTYKRVQTNQFPKLRNDMKWRRPKGMGNKDRKNRKGHTGTLKVGYGSPKSLKGTNRQGFQEKLVHNVEDIKSVDSKTQVPVIGKTVGGRKKIAILEEARQLNLSVANVRDIDSVLSKLKESKSNKKQSTTKNHKKEDTTREDKEEVKEDTNSQQTKSEESSKEESQTKPNTNSQKGGNEK